MRKVLFFNEKEADKLHITSLGKIEKGYNDVWTKNLYEYLTDVDGNKYLICHGTKEGCLVFSGIAIDEAFQCYRKAVSDGFIKKGEHLSIICCHGAAVKESTEAKREWVLDIWDDWKESDYNFSFLNETDEVAYLSKIKCKNGTFKVPVWTEENKFNSFIYKLRNAF